MKRLLFEFALFMPMIFFSCKKEYITNEYITNSVENHYSNKYYLPDEMEEITDIKTPPYLKQGDTVAVFAISNSVTRSEVVDGIKVLKSWGLNVVESANLYDVDSRYAGSVSDRIEGLQPLIDNPHIKAIIAARGGYGAAQVLPYIDLKSLEEHPKWMVGFSDLTVFHAALNNKGIMSIHGAMASNLKDKESVATLKEALFGDLKSYTVPTNKNSIIGEAEGRLVGGNLSIIYSLGGTLYDLNVRDAILLIEDVGENNYHLDRMLQNLKLSGKLDCVKGVIVGEFTQMKQGSDKSVEEIITSNLKSLGIPVLYGMKVGHEVQNMSVYLGGKVKMVVGSGNSTIEFNFK